MKTIIKTITRALGRRTMIDHITLRPTLRRPTIAHLRAPEGTACGLASDGLAALPYTVALEPTTILIDRADTGEQVDAICSHCLGMTAGRKAGNFK